MSHQQKRELLILRHAKSDWGTGTATDFERPLSKRGEFDAPKMGKWMHTNKLVPDITLSFSAKHATQTLNAVINVLNMPKSTVHFDRRIYLASLETLLKVIAECPDSKYQLLIVGHNPGLEELLRYLAHGDLPYTQSGKLLTTANLARIELPHTWQQLEPHCGKLITLIRPKEIG